MATKPCWKCGGTGVIERYKHIENGKCFACGGDGELSVTDSKRISKEYAVKGIKTLKVSHLLKVTREYLSPELAQQYDMALREAGRKVLGIPISDDYNITVLKIKLRKAEKRDKNGMRIAGSKEGKIHNGMVYAGIESGVLQQKGSVASEIYESWNGNFNRMGHRILYPLTPEETYTADTNTLKPLGDPRIDFIRKLMPDYIQEVKYNQGATVARDMEPLVDKILDSVEKDFGGIIANVMFEEVILATKDDGVLGTYFSSIKGPNGINQNYGLRLNLNPLLGTVANKKDYPNSEDYEKALFYRTEQLRETIVHELAHAYHYQALGNRKASMFGNETTTDSETPMANPIVHLYEDKLLELERMGLSEDYVTNFFDNYSGLEFEDAKKIFSQFSAIYGATNYKEYYATTAEAMINPKRLALLERKHPEDYEMLKNSLRGVVDFEALIKNTDKERQPN